MNVNPLIERERKKASLNILILGSYSSKVKHRLLELKECLIDKGYIKARLVEDFPNKPRFHTDPDIHFTLKSTYYIENWAHEILYVFFLNIDNQGVTSEFRFTTLKIPEKLRYSIMLFEKGEYLSTQIRGPMKIARMETYEFNDNEDLCERAEAKSIDTVDVLYEIL